jgi:hypothetical protein
MGAYLLDKKLPALVRRKAGNAIALHRSSSVLSATFDFTEASHAICVIADKLVGDENRVRERVRKELQDLQNRGLIETFSGSIHDRANFAIKSAEVLLDGPDQPTEDDMGVIMLQIQLDESIADASCIYNLYDSRFRSCEKAANYLGFIFRLEFNGKRYHLTNFGWSEIASTHLALD